MRTELYSLLIVGIVACVALFALLSNSSPVDTSSQSYDLIIEDPLLAAQLQDVVDSGEGAEEFIAALQTAIEDADSNLVGYSSIRLDEYMGINRGSVYYVDTGYGRQLHYQPSGSDFSFGFGEVGRGYGVGIRIKF